jgi:hypothetical protein
MLQCARDSRFNRDNGDLREAKDSAYVDTRSRRGKGNDVDAADVVARCAMMSSIGRGLLLRSHRLRKHRENTRCSDIPMLPVWFRCSAKPEHKRNLISTKLIHATRSPQFLPTDVKVCRTASVTILYCSVRERIMLARGCETRDQYHAAALYLEPCAGGYRAVHKAVAFEFRPACSHG